MKLEKFLPYKLSVLSNKVSLGISKYYREKYNITVAEWRVLALLSDTAEQTAKDLSCKSQMDKVKISRTVRILEQKKLITEQSCKTDGRSKRYGLTVSGNTLILRVKPKAKAFESKLIQSLSKRELEEFKKTLDNLYSKAEKIIEEME